MRVTRTQKTTKMTTTETKVTTASRGSSTTSRTRVPAMVMMAAMRLTRPTPQNWRTFSTSEVMRVRSRPVWARS
jgi:hypothetical protein